MSGRRGTVAVFHERVQEVVARSGLSQAAFARHAGIDRSTLSQLLDERNLRLPRAETLAAIAGACRVSVDWLLGLSQREEIGAEIIEAVLQVEKGVRAPIDDRFVAWLEEARGYRVKTVPLRFPDFLKTEPVLRFEYGPSPLVDADRSIEAAHERLDILRQPEIEIEAAVSIQALEMFAAGSGIWQGLPRARRRDQVARMRQLYDELYPSLRLYLFDERAASSAPFTIFGPKRVALFLGHLYLVFNAVEHMRLFAHRFDELIRAAAVQPHAIGDHLAALERRVAE